MKAACTICPHQCGLDPGQTGLCGARQNIEGKVISENYGKTTSIALDPVEKKPFRMFHPGSKILSTGSYGCNLHCPFCQNHTISMPTGTPDTFDVTPEALVKKALSLKDLDNIGIAFTYNEPIVGYEYVLDCAKLAREEGLKTAMVTNGYINEGPLAELLPHIDAMNIDVKGFRADFYKQLGGDLEVVLHTVSLAVKKTHVEITALIIPGENDSPGEMLALSQWLSKIDNEIPLHISRFFPRHKYADKAPTPVDTIDGLVSVAKRFLRYVYAGNR